MDSQIIGLRNQGRRNDMEGSVFVMRYRRDLATSYDLYRQPKCRWLLKGNDSPQQ